MRDLILMCMAAGVMLAAALGAEAGAAPAERWTAGRAWEWYRAQPWIVGTNYVPSTAANTTEFWQAESFAPPTIGRELGWAADLGFNACRVFVQYAVWKADPTGLKARLGRFLGIAEGHGIRTVVGLFDDCTFGDPPQTEPYLGRQREPIPGMIAPSWTPSPGLKEVEDRAAWPSLEAYLKDLVGTFARDGRVLMWDLYNEPGNSGMGNRSLPLVEAAFGWARAAAPTQPVTSGVWGGTAEITARLLELSDVVTFHRYGDTASVRGAIADLKATGRPLVCTEWMARLLGSRWETDLPVFQAEDVGCLNWGLVNGRTQAQFPWGSPRGAPEPKVWFHDLLHRDGTPYDGAEVAAIREVTGHLTPTLARVECHGWHCWRLSNGLVDVTVAPQLGGRIIQIALGGHGFLWVNPDLQGRAPPPTRLGPKGEWLNWGGEKIWPAPQGWGKGDQWPGPPDPVLDGGPYAFEVLRQDAEEVAVRLTSEKDARSGIQFSRVIRLRRGSAAVSVEATMANICDRPRRWSIWAIAQMDGRRPGGGWSPDLWAYCPANPASRFPGGYKVLFGPADNPSWRPVPAVGLVAVQFQYRVGKIGLDSPGGWVAAVDRSSGGALVHTFPHEAGRRYPDGCSVEFWSQGLGSFTAWGKENVMKDDPAENPPYLEAEVLSPLAQVRPGESYSFSYSLTPTSVGVGAVVVGRAKAGVVVEPLLAVRGGAGVSLSGRFGVFAPGQLRLQWRDAAGATVREDALGLWASPRRAVLLDVAGRPPAGATSVALVEYGPDGAGLGELGTAPLGR